MKITDLCKMNEEEHKVSLSKAEQLDEILLFFRENPQSSRDQFIALSQDLGVTKEEFEQLEFELCKSMCSRIGKHINHGKETVDETQLQKGIEHEMEHTNDEYIARLIALDHLYEIPDYYDQLSKFDKN